MLSAISSSKHHPNPRKRPIDLVAPEFPSLPKMSLEATVEFAVKSQEALRSIPTISTSVASLFLPLISPHQLQYRFKVRESAVFIVMRKSYPLLKNELDSFNIEDLCGIYVRGPVGVGKSYLLYLLAAEYRLNRNHYRVTYINDCAEWKTDPYDYLLRELIMKFCNDSINGNCIADLCEKVLEGNKEDKMIRNLMKDLIAYIESQKLQWIVICDQHNAFYARSVVVDQFPFNLINYLSRKRRSNIKIIISASADNEGYPTEMKGWLTHDISSHRFDQEEFKVWCDHYLLEDHTKVNHESEEALDALFWTGGVPYELDLLWKQTKNGLIEKTLPYRNERVTEMRESHGKFCDKLSDEKKSNLKECISRMALGLSPPEGLEGMDRQLFDIINDEDGQKIITSLNPVAHRALLVYRLMSRPYDFPWVCC